MSKIKAENTTVKSPKKKRKPLKAWQIILILVILFVAVPLGINAMTNSKGDTTSVATTVAAKGSVISTLETSGTIASELTRTYASPVTAEVAEVNVVAGQAVKKGDYLLTYDTASLEKSYNVDELQAKADQATVDDSLQKNNKNAAEKSTSASDITTLQAQVNTAKGELDALNAQMVQLQVAANDNTGLQTEITGFQTELTEVNSQIAALQTKQTSGTITAEETAQLASLESKKDTLEEKISKREKKMTDATDLANSTTNLQAQITAKTNEVSDLQSRLTEAQSKNTSADAALLTDSQKANLDYTKEASRLKLEESADKMEKAKAGVVADFDGIVTNIKASAGFAAEEGGELMTLASSEDMCVNIPVSKYNLENLALDQKADITFQGHTYTGKVSYISRVAQTGTDSSNTSAMVMIKVHVDNPDENLIIGLDANVSITLGTAENVIRVPTTAVNTDNKGDFVYVVKKNIVSKKYVTLGLNSTDYTEIKDGISNGDVVVSTVSSDLVDGTTVTTTEDTEALADTAGTEAANTSGKTADVNGTEAK